jgi:hypothetical protein
MLSQLLGKSPENAYFYLAYIFYPEEIKDL